MITTLCIDLSLEKTRPEETLERVKTVTYVVHVNAHDEQL